MTTAKKITLATLKSFIRKAGDKLHVMQMSRFDSMQDMVVDCASQFSPAKPAYNPSNGNEGNMGIEGVWVVRGGRNVFEEYNKNGFSGIEARNCCGSFVVAVPIS